MTGGSIRENIARYAKRNQLKIGKRLGLGIHGSVFQATYPNGAVVAIKHHVEVDPFIREFEVYARLDELGVKEVSGFIVPRLSSVDEELRILEMTTVSLERYSTTASRSLVIWSGGSLPMPPRTPSGRRVDGAIPNPRRS